MAKLGHLCTLCQGAGAGVRPSGVRASYAAVSGTGTLRVPVPTAGPSFGWRCCEAARRRGSTASAQAGCTPSASTRSSPKAY